MAITRLNSLAIPAGTIVESDLSYPLTNFSSTGIDDNATSIAITIDSSENVGVGGSPVSSIRRLMVTDTGDVRVDIRSGSDTNLGAIDFSDTSNTARGQLVYDHNDDSMQFKTLSTDRMRITSDGNVWIGGTFAANSQLAVSKGTAAGLEVICERTVGGTVDTGAVRFLSYDRTGLAFTDLAYDAAEHIFGNGSTERMRIDSSGTVNIGTTAASGTSGNVGHGFTQNGRTISNCDADWNYEIYGAQGNRLRFFGSQGGGTQVGSVTVTTSATAYNTTSDQRLKENIVDAPAGNIDAIRVRSFDWKADGSHQTYGMVAQELVEVAPEAVTQGQTEDDMWGVDYSKLVPMMIKEIQDLKAEVAALKGA
jgi:hypothetical protein